MSVEHSCQRLGQRKTEWLSGENVNRLTRLAKPCKKWSVQRHTAMEEDIEELKTIHSQQYELEQLLLSLQMLQDHFFNSDDTEKKIRTFRKFRELFIDRKSEREYLKIDSRFLYEFYPLFSEYRIQVIPAELKAIFSLQRPTKDAQKITELMRDFYFLAHVGQIDPAQPRELRTWLQEKAGDQLDQSPYSFWMQYLNQLLENFDKGDFGLKIRA